MPPKPSLARRRKVGRWLYRQYCAGATAVELRRWYGISEPLLWELMIGGMRVGERCSIDRG